MTESCVILGAGGHAKVIAEILMQQNIPIKGFLDDDSQKWGVISRGLPVLGGIDTFADYLPCTAIIGVGDNSTRRMLAERFNLLVKGQWQNAIHPSAIISSYTRIGCGVVIMAGTIINADATIGNHVILNTRSTIEHDCVIGNYVHIAPGVDLAGGVSVGEESMIGIGATVIPMRKIGCRSMVGAGAVVVDDIPDDVTAKGVPARW